LRFVTGCGALGRVVAIANTRRVLFPVDVIATDGEWGSFRVGFFAFCLLVAAWGRLGEMVTLARLVINDRDGACIGAAERVLVCRVGDI
jgi:hypothetical protein